MIDFIITTIALLYRLAVSIDAVEASLEAAAKFNLPTGLVFSVCLGESGCGARGRVLYGANIRTDGRIETDYFQQAMAGARVLWRHAPRGWQGRRWMRWQRALEVYRGEPGNGYARRAVERWRGLCAASGGLLCEGTLSSADRPLSSR